MSDRLKGKTAIISGAASGIGAACASVFAEEGAKVVLGDINIDAGQSVADQINANFPGAVVFQHLDVTDSRSWMEIVAKGEETFGQVDILVSNAGIVTMAGLLGEDEETWNKVVAVNQTGVWRGMRAAAPAMQRAGGGSIVLISSVWGRYGTAGATAYLATKGAVVQMAKSVAAELAEAGIRANVVLPGIIDTPFLNTLTLEQRTGIAGGSLLRREGKPAEVALAAVYLASDESSYVTGAEFFIDGGYSTC